METNTVGSPNLILQKRKLRLRNDAWLPHVLHAPLRSTTVYWVSLWALKAGAPWPVLQGRGESLRRRQGFAAAGPRLRTGKGSAESKALSPRDCIMAGPFWSQ